MKVINYLDRKYSDFQTRTIPSYPNTTYYFHNGLLMFERDDNNNYFFFNQDEIFFDLETYCGFTNTEIKRMLKLWVEKKFNIENAWVGVMSAALVKMIVLKNFSY